jgi:carbon-monoxide dehydrogenase large subunit
MIKFGVGQPVTRLEDARLLKGRGRSAAATAPGVQAVYTGADYAADGLAMPKAAMSRNKADGSPPVF